MKTALEIAHSLYEASLQNSSQNRRQTHAALQEKLNGLLVDIRLYEKGLKVINYSNGRQENLSKIFIILLITAPSSRFTSSACEIFA